MVVGVTQCYFRAKILFIQVLTHFAGTRNYYASDNVLWLEA